jgi:hypothetical protein
LAVAKELGTAAGREVDPKGGGFKPGSDNPLECDLLVVDETSMVDVTVDAGVELVRRENAAVSSNQRALFIDEHRDGPAPLADRGGDLRHLLVGMSACIAGVGDEFCDRPPLDLIRRPLRLARALCAHPRAPADGGKCSKWIWSTSR